MKRLVIYSRDRYEELDGVAGVARAFVKGGQVTERPLTVDEIASLPAPLGADVRAGLRLRIRQALDENAEFLALGAPTTGQTIAQVRRLTRQHNAIIRLLAAIEGDSDLLVESADV